MIPAVFLVLVLVGSSLSHPLTSQEFVATGIQTAQTVGNQGLLNSQGTTTGEKTAIGGVPTQVNQNVEKIQTPSHLGQTIQQDTTQVHPGTPLQYFTPQIEKTGVQHSSEGCTSQQFSENYPKNSQTSKGGNVPTALEHAQPIQNERPVVLSVQPLTIVPVVPSELVQPVVVPAEAVTTGRMIMMAIEPIQQRNFQSVIGTQEEQVQNQKITPPVTYNIVQGQEVGQTYQPFSAQPIEKQETQAYDQTNVFIKEQLGQSFYVKGQAIQQPIEPVQNYNPTTAVEPNVQDFSVQPNVQPVVNQYVEKQVPQQSTRTTPELIQPEETSFSQQQSYNVQQGAEKQGEVQQVTSYTSAQSQGVEPGYQQQQYPVKSVASGNVQPYQQYQQNEGFFEKQTSVPSQTGQVFNEQHPTEKQTPFQQVSDFSTGQNQQKGSAVQSENYLSPVTVQHQPAEYQAVPQVYNVLPEHQQGYPAVQSHSVKQVENINQSAEKQVPVEQSIQIDQSSQSYPKAVIAQQQVSTFQPYLANPAEALQPENAGYDPQPQVYVVQPQQGANYPDKTVYNFGSTVQQNTPIQVLAPLAQYQSQVVNPSVVPPRA